MKPDRLRDASVIMMGAHLPGGPPGVEVLAKFPACSIPGAGPDGGDRSGVVAAVGRRRRLGGAGTVQRCIDAAGGRGFAADDATGSDRVAGRRNGCGASGPINGRVCAQSPSSPARLGPFWRLVLAGTSHRPRRILTVSWDWPWTGGTPAKARCLGVVYRRGAGGRSRRNADHGIRCRYGGGSGVDRFGGCGNRGNSPLEQGRRRRSRRKVGIIRKCFPACGLVGAGGCPWVAVEGHARLSRRQCMLA